jgi:archaellum biogenesis protein FlaJ (TadC family)
MPESTLFPALIALVALSVVMFFGSLALIPVLLVRMPADYFARSESPFESWRRRHPLAGMLLQVARNLLGVVLLLAGLAMMVLPGQGIITILMALTLLNFPGKRRLELRIIRQRQVQRGINWIRERAGRPPLVVP